MVGNRAGGRVLRVVAAGECMLELSRQGGLWRLGAAGDSFNTALYMARQGAVVRYLTALGDDPFSQEMLQNWRAEGLDTSLVLRDASRLPGLYAIRTDEHGERSFYYWRENSAARQLLQLPGSEAALQAAVDCDLLYLTGITLSLCDESGRRRWGQLAAEVRARGGQVAFDPNYRPRGWGSPDAARQAMQAIAPRVDYLLVSQEDHQLLFGQAAALPIGRYWLDAGAREVVIKLGSAGAAAMRGGQIVESATTAVTVLDSTGAGDAFNAAYLSERLSGGDVEQALRAGNQLAGAVVQVPGAILPASAGGG